MNPGRHSAKRNDCQEIHEEAKKAFANYIDAGENLNYKTIRWQMFEDRIPDRILECMYDASVVATYTAWLANFRLAVFNEPLLEKKEKKRRLQNMTTEDWIAKNTVQSMILYFETHFLDDRNKIIDYLTSCNFVHLDANGGRASFRGGRSDDKHHELQKFSDAIRSFATANNISIYAIYRMPDPGMGLFITEDFLQKQKLNNLLF